MRRKEERPQASGKGTRSEAPGDAEDERHSDDVQQHLGRVERQGAPVPESEVQRKRELRDGGVVSETETVGAKEREKRLRSGGKGAFCHLMHGVVPQHRFGVIPRGEPRPEAGGVEDCDSGQAGRQQKAGPPVPGAVERLGRLGTGT
jgi:hypothetical protein